MRRVLRAFTLVEILIVVIVLGILAAIVVPQFSDASTDAKDNSLKTNLQIIRGQIELYKMQHNTLPVVATFGDQLTQYTDSSGGTSATKDATHIYGPYLQTIPNNPFTATNDVTAEAVASTKAWYYNATTGEFRANDSVAHRAY